MILANCIIRSFWVLLYNHIMYLYRGVFAHAYTLAQQIELRFFPFVYYTIRIAKPWSNHRSKLRGVLRGRVPRLVGWYNGWFSM